MTQFYQKHTDSDTTTRYFISFKSPTGQSVEIEVSKSVFLSLEELQREHWRLERSESRHTHHLEFIPEWCLPESAQTQSPEQLMLEHFENKRLCSALKQLPPVQLRRFLLRHCFELSSQQIAAIDDCSTRVVDRSIFRAREKLQKLLKEGV